LASGHGRLCGGLHVGGSEQNKGRGPSAGEDDGECECECAGGGGVTLARDTFEVCSVVEGDDVPDEDDGDRVRLKDI
jgi:hypothetical protein